MAANGRMTITGTDTRIYLRTWTNGYIVDAMKCLVRIPRRIARDGIRRMWEDAEGVIDPSDRTPSCWFATVVTSFGDKIGEKVSVDILHRHYRAGNVVEVNEFSIAKWFCEGWFNSWHVVSKESEMKAVRGGNMLRCLWDSNVAELSASASITKDNRDAIQEEIDRVTPKDRPKDVRPSIVLKRGVTVLNLPLSGMIMAEVCESVYELRNNGVRACSIKTS